jgi:hypothetical protein
VSRVRSANPACATVTSVQPRSVLADAFTQSRALATLASEIRGYQDGNQRRITYFIAQAKRGERLRAGASPLKSDARAGTNSRALLEVFCGHPNASTVLPEAPGASSSSSFVRLPARRTRHALTAPRFNRLSKRRLSCALDDCQTSREECPHVALEKQKVREPPGMACPIFVKG